MSPVLHGGPVSELEVSRAGERRRLINLSSYNYLGLATHPEVVEAGREALVRYGSGACGSPLLSGQTELHQALEAALCRFLEREAVLLFSSGYGAGMGALAGILRKGDVAILDEKSHLCLQDGARTPRARLKTFKHNDPQDLERVLAQSEGTRRVLVLEGVYSMDGTEARLAELTALARAHQVGVIVDEAHSILVCGPGGRGLAAGHPEVKLQVGTFSKAFAHVGGFVAGSRELIDYLRFYTNAYGFSCALPPAVVAGLLKALEVATRDDSLREALSANAERFRAGALAMGLDLGGARGHVLPILVGSDRRALFARCEAMNRRGLFLAPIDYPSVPHDALRYRVALSAAHRPEELDRALEILEDVLVRGRA